LKLCSINLADRWRCKCAVRATVKKHAHAGYFKHPSLPHRTSYCREIFRCARHVRILQVQVVWSLCVVSSLRNDALNFEKISKIAKLAKFGEPYLDLGKEIAKHRLRKVISFTHEQYAARIIYLAIARCPTSFGKAALSEKFENLRGSLGAAVRVRASKFFSHRVP